MNNEIKLDTVKDRYYAIAVLKLTIMDEYKNKVYLDPDTNEFVWRSAIHIDHVVALHEDTLGGGSWQIYDPSKEIAPPSQKRIIDLEEGEAYGDKHFIAFCLPNRWAKTKEEQINPTKNYIYIWPDPNFQNPIQYISKGTAALAMDKLDPFTGDIIISFKDGKLKKADISCL